VGGMPTVLPFHRAVVADPAFAGEPLRVHTRWIETEFDAPMPPQESAEASEIPDREKLTVEVGGKRLEVVVPAGFGLARPRGVRGDGSPRERGGLGGASPRASTARRSVHTGTGDIMVRPMQGTIIKIAVTEGQRVAAGGGN